MKRILIKFALLLSLSFFLGYLSRYLGFNVRQALSVSIFSASILGTLFFWDFRLSFAFLGTSVLLITNTINLESLIRFSSLEIILFLVVMMVLIGLLKEEGVFAWIVSFILRIRHLTARKFILAISLISALFACAVDEVTSIIFVVAAVLEICDYFEVDPVPFIITAVFTTNVGSAGTVLGNPIGILIATKAGLSFEDFIMKAFPLMAFCLLVVIVILILWFRKAVDNLDRKMKELGANEILIRLISIPMERQLRISIGIFASTLILIASHHRLELLLGLQKNTLLLVAPLVSSGLIMIWRYKKARHYIEAHVEWWTLLFFLLLFAQAGTLKYTGATDIIAKRLLEVVQHSQSALLAAVLWISAIGSSILDNVVLVAAFVPVMQSFRELGFNLQPLWWALLFGGCFGGNITLVGSTANIVALGILEKERGIKISFFKWLGIGLLSSVVIIIIAWIGILCLPIYR